jgi:hypothetical protein
MQQRGHKDLIDYPYVVLVMSLPEVNTACKTRCAGYAGDGEEGDVSVGFWGSVSKGAHNPGG